MSPWKHTQHRFRTVGHIAPRAPRLLARGLLGISLLLLVALPAARPEPSGEPPTLSVTDRLDERRYVATGDRAYIVGTQEGRFPAMGFHTRGEMGGIWSPPIKLLDGLWFGIDGEWLRPARRFTSGYGHVRMELPGRGGLRIERTDFVPDGERAALFGLRFTAGETDESFTLGVDAHSELMGSYPWGATEPDQTGFNLQDTSRFDGERLIFREKGTPPAENALPHDWAAVVGSSLDPVGGETGEGYRGPQDPPEVCPASGPNAEPPGGCDDTEFGKGRGGQLRYEISVPAGETKTVWFAVAGADHDGENPEDAVAEALARHRDALRNPEAALEEKISGRLALRRNTRLDLPGDRRLQESIDWSKQNLADSVMLVEDLEVRETNAGKNYPPPEGELRRARFLGAGFHDYPWLFATDGEYTAFASVAAGQFEPIKDHLRALREVSEIDNGGSGKVVHEAVFDGSVYFGSNADPGNTDETAKFPSAVALVWRWTGDNAFRDEMYGFAKNNMEYIFRELDRDGDLWPEGLGNVEREGMGEEKLDNAVYTIRGLYDLADMARSKGDGETFSWAMSRAERMERRFEGAWWMPEVPQHADSLENPENTTVQQRHWIGVTPMEAELVRAGETLPGLATREHGNEALELRETPCYGGPGDEPGGNSGLYHTGAPGCDPVRSSRPAEKTIFTLNTAVMAVGEGNYGRLGPDGQQRFTTANAELQLIPDEQPGAMPEIAPSPDYGRSIDRPFNERAMVLQAWGAYGTLWPAVHQQLGVRPDMGRGRLEVAPQVPPQSPGLSGENIRVGDGSVAVSASAASGVYRTTVRPDVELEEFTIGHTVPYGEKVRSVTLDGERVAYRIRETNRGQEVIVRARPAGEQTLVVETRK